MLIVAVFVLQVLDQTSPAALHGPLLTHLQEVMDTRTTDSRVHLLSSGAL